MLNFPWRTAPLVAVLVTLAACGGGGGGGGPSYSISVSPTSVSLSGVQGGAIPSQSVTVTFVGQGVVVGTLPGQPEPGWLMVNAPSQATSPVMVNISASALTAPGSYSTTLRFVTGKADGSSVVYVDVPVTLQMVAGATIDIDAHGISPNGSVGVSYNNGPPVAFTNDMPGGGFGEFAMGSNYTLTVSTEPTGEICTFPNGSPTMSGVLNNNLQFELNCNASLIPWIWVGGTQTANDSVVYGTRLMAAAGNTPGGRVPVAYAHDAAGNLWVFGGADLQGSRNDLWRYDIATGLWTWMSGSSGLNALGVYGTLGQASSTNAPGARFGAVAWVDANGNFWLFGGFGFGASMDGQGVLNDLWMYNLAADTWTWVAGANDIDNASVGTYGTTPSVSNIPGGRMNATVAQDATGAVWFFGGSGVGSSGPGLAPAMGYMNDLWKFDPASGVWTWVSGSDQPGAAAVQGTQGVPDPLNHPGARQGPSSWTDGNGGIWIFGGTNPANNGLVNDLWRFDTATGIWTWMNGTDPTTGLLAIGIYNPPGTSNGNVPSGRAYAAAWTDPSGNLWLFGGFAVTETFIQTPQAVNDLWKYTPATNSWQWLSGSNAANSPAVFGTQGVASNMIVPSSRNQAAGWIDPSGKLWLWGGASFAGDLNDIWTVVPQ